MCKSSTVSTEIMSSSSAIRNTIFLVLILVMSTVPDVGFNRHSSGLRLTKRVNGSKYVTSHLGKLSLAILGLRWPSSWVARLRCKLVHQRLHFHRTQRKVMPCGAFQIITQFSLDILWQNWATSTNMFAMLNFTKNMSLERSFGCAPCCWNMTQNEFSFCKLLHSWPALFD